MLSQDLRKNFAELACVLALLVISVRILTNACETCRVVSATDKCRRNTEKSVGSEIGRKAERTERIRVETLIVSIDQRRATREAQSAGQYQGRAECVRVIDRKQMRRTGVLPAATGICEVLEAVIGCIAVPVL